MPAIRVTVDTAGEGYDLGEPFEWERSHSFVFFAEDLRVQDLLDYLNYRFAKGARD